MHSYSSLPISLPMSFEPRCLPTIVFPPATASSERRHGASCFCRVRPYAALAAEALVSEYLADAEAAAECRWERQRLLYIGSDDGDSVLRGIPTAVISAIANAMNPSQSRHHLTATSSSVGHPPTRT